MKTKLERISQLSISKPEMKFNSIGHLINKDMLMKCHRKMDANKAVGIDGVTKADYMSNLDENINNLMQRLMNKSYIPKPARVVEIPKDNGKTRPLSIYAYEDKLVQEALRELIEAVFEPHFYEEMCGFRPNRGCHDAIKRLNDTIEGNKVNYILDADIKGFFQNIDHDWAMKFIKSKITDPNIIRLVNRMLKAGTIKDYAHEATNSGAGQGAICSPIIANIYMHYVLVWWFKERIQPYMKGYCGLVVYADDFVCCFQYKEEAELFYKRLIKRMKHFGLCLEESKSRLIEFGRFAKANLNKQGLKVQTFDFLGFTHYCSESRNGRFRVKRKTSSKKFRKKCKEMNQLIKELRFDKKVEIIRKINVILVGYYRYYGITDNFRSLDRFRYRVIKLLYFWLNRRSQRRSYTWEGFNNLLWVHTITKPKIYVNIYG